MHKFVFKTISESLLYHISGEPIFLRLFNFSDGTYRINLSKNIKIKNRIGAFNATWIRIYTKKSTYYDFISSDLFLIANQKGLMLMCSEDTQKIDSIFFAKEINQRILDGTYKFLNNKEYLENYYEEIKQDLKMTFKKLNYLYSFQEQVQLKNDDFDEKYVDIKNYLRKKYLQELIFKKEFKNNKNKIINLLV